MNKKHLKEIKKWLDEANCNFEPEKEKPIKLDWEQYEVMGYYKSKKNTLETLFTYEDCWTLEEAENCIKLWKENHNVLFWYINGYDLEHKGLKGYYKLVKWGN